MHTQYKTKKSSAELITLVSLGSVKNVKLALTEWNWDPNVANGDCTTPVLKAAERNDDDMLKLLIEYGARLDVTDIAGYTPLQYAQENKNQDMVKLIEQTLKQQAEKEKQTKPNPKR